MKKIQNFERKKSNFKQFRLLKEILIRGFYSLDFCKACDV